MGNETVVTDPPVAPAGKVDQESPEFKAAVKAERDRIEASIKESNKTHLDKREGEILAHYESQYGPANTPPAAPPSAGGKDFFVELEEKTGTNAEAMRTVSGAIIQHVTGVIDE
ncbi:hypothetical protein LCGC14_2941330, partial [marine sediment metagenome]